MKVKTLQNKVNALTKLNIKELDFEGVSQDGQHTNIDPQLKEIKRSLSIFSRQLRTEERKYLNNHINSQIETTFSKLVDYYQGDGQKALTIINAVVDNVIKTVPNNNKVSDNDTKTNLVAPLKIDNDDHKMLNNGHDAT